MIIYEKWPARRTTCPRTGEILFSFTTQVRDQGVLQSSVCTKTLHSNYQQSRSEWKPFIGFDESD